MKESQLVICFQSQGSRLLEFPVREQSEELGNGSGIERYIHPESYSESRRYAVLSGQQKT